MARDEDVFGFRKRTASLETIARLHNAVVDASREPGLYRSGMLPDTVEGRFESLVLHVLLLLRRLRTLPPPADDIAQELVDAVFAHLEIAMRESGVGDMGVPKRMKKLARAFYDRTLRYEEALTAGDEEAVAGEVGRRLALPSEEFSGIARYMLDLERRLAGCDLDRLLDGSAWAGA